MWKVFEIKNLGEYHNLYLKTDVLLLCDEFEKFIKPCLDYYCLGPCHYFSSPGLSWVALLKMTVERKRESGGGISYISERYAKADDNSTIMYWDANDSYG